MRLEELLERAAALNLRSPLTNGDVFALRPIAQTLAEHVECSPGDISWWCGACSGIAETEQYTITKLAREAAVRYPRVYAGTLSTAEGERVMRVLADERDRRYGTIMRFLLASERAHLVATISSYETIATRTVAWSEDERDAGIDVLREAQATAREHVTTAERALAPLAWLPAGAEASVIDDATIEAVNVTPRSNAHLGRLRCSRCSHVWHPRVERPGKCPRCQSIIYWPGETVPV